VPSGNRHAGAVTPGSLTNDRSDRLYPLTTIHRDLPNFIWPVGGAL
jgi:hypothetical protein